MAVGGPVIVRGLWHYVVGALTGSLFLHHKGGVYRLLYVAHEATNARKPVPNPYVMRDPLDGLVAVYVSLAEGDVHTRDLKEWNGYVAGRHHRFECMNPAPVSPWAIYQMLKKKE